MFIVLITSVGTSIRATSVPAEDKRQPGDNHRLDHAFGPVLPDVARYFAAARLAVAEALAATWPDLPNPLRS